MLVSKGYLAVFEQDTLQELPVKAILGLKALKQQSKLVLIFLALQLGLALTSHSFARRAIRESF